MGRQSMPRTFVLVHSQLVGPTTWAPVARELERRGQHAVVPSLLEAARADPPDWRWAVSAVRASVPMEADPVILVGHSGGGLLLPAIAGSIDRTVSKLIFVDSDVPARVGETPLMPAAFLDELRPLAVDGVLPPWSAWFGDEAMRDLVPDDAVRARLMEEMPSLPLAFFDQRVPSPPGWERISCAYLLLSDAYRDAAKKALGRSWVVDEIPGAQHLHIVVDPEVVTGKLLQFSGI
jgi:pimeloyl-ACP methyl ester carboxylesterase